MSLTLCLSFSVFFIMSLSLCRVSFPATFTNQIQVFHWQPLLNRITTASDTSPRINEVLSIRQTRLLCCLWNYVTLYFHRGSLQTLGCYSEIWISQLLSKICRRFPRHYCCAAVTSADESENCWACGVFFGYTRRIILPKTISSSDERCLEKLFHLWDIVSLLSHRRHSDWVRYKILMHLEIAAIICFLCLYWTSFSPPA